MALAVAASTCQGARTTGMMGSSEVIVVLELLSTSVDTSLQAANEVPIARPALLRVVFLINCLRFIFVCVSAVSNQLLAYQEQVWFGKRKIADIRSRLRQSNTRTEC